jgi:hypothetical protein
MYVNFLILRNFLYHDFMHESRGYKVKKNTYELL